MLDSAWADNRRTDAHSSVADASSDKCFFEDRHAVIVPGENELTADCLACFLNAGKMLGF
jgi:hypothetical protein